MRAERSRQLASESTISKAVAGDIRSRGFRNGSAPLRGIALTVGLSLVPGVVLTALSATATKDAEALPRRPIDAVERLQENGDAAELFQRQCVACHGKKGKGDGPAAPAMTPRPANLTDPEQIGELSDEELVDVLTNGRGAMPSFGALLNPDQIEAMVGYIRELSGTETESESESGGPS